MAVCQNVTWLWLDLLQLVWAANLLNCRSRPTYISVLIKYDVLVSKRQITIER